MECYAKRRKMKHENSSWGISGRETAWQKIRCYRNLQVKHEPTMGCQNQEMVFWGVLTKMSHQTHRR